jgi:hypothetical protein
MSDNLAGMGASDARRGLVVGLIFSTHNLLYYSNFP